MIGILDLQGGVVEHLGHFKRLGVPARRVKTLEELDTLTGLVLPGGESTCLGRLLRIFGLDAAIRRRAAAGLHMWGTCAGTILLANEIEGETPHLRLLDITVRRNAFGSQLDSFNTVATVPEVAPKPVPLTFIRAPVITRVGPGVRVLLEVRGATAAVTAPGILATIFHPELTPTLAFHAYFARQCGLTPLLPASGPTDPAWSPEAWTQLAPLPGPAASG
jgi:5'-phosphate synthase pdxT subunit